MNHIYRLVWNNTRHMLVAVAEHANSHDKQAGTDSGGAATAPPRGGPGARTLLATALVALFPLVALAQIVPSSTCVVDFQEVRELRDTDSSNADVAGCNLTNNGILDISATNNGSSLYGLNGSGSVLTGFQTLTLTNAGDLYQGTIGGMGGLTLDNGYQELAGVNTFTGATAIGINGYMALSGSASVALSSGVVNEGVLNLSGMNSGTAIRSLSGSGTVYLGSQDLTLSNANDIFAGSIYGDGGVGVGSGFLLLSGASGYTGATMIGADATLALVGSGSIALSSVVANQGLFDISATNDGAQIQSLSGSGSVYLGGQTLTLSNANDTYAGTIAGSGGLSIAGGTEVLSGLNSYTGITAIGSQATLALAGSGSIATSSGVVDNGVFDIAATSGASVQSLSGSGAVLLGGQTLTLSGASDLFAGSISGSGGLSIGAGTEVLTGTNTYTGATTIERAAVLALSGSGSIALAAGVANNGVFDISASNNGAQVRSLSGSGSVLLGGQTLTLTSAADHFSGHLLGSGGLAIAGGSESLSAAQGYTGATSIAAGATLALAGSGAVALSAGVANNGVFDISASSNGGQIRSLSGSGSVLLGENTLALSAAAGTFNGSINGNGGLHVGGGTLTLGGANTYTGTTLVDGGATLRISADANLGTGSAAVLLNNGTLQAASSLVHERGLALTNLGTVNVEGSAIMQENGDVTGSGTLVKQGSGTLILRGTLGNSGGLQVSKGTLDLSGSNTYTGGTQVSSGAVLRIASDANLGAATGKLTLDGGTLQTTTTMDIARAVALTSATGTVDTAGADSVVTLNGQVSGDGRMIKEGAGTLVLAGDNGGGKGSANQAGDGWTGGLTVNDGVVKVTNAYGLGWGSVLTFNGGSIYSTVNIATGQTIRMSSNTNTNINTETGTTTTLSGELLSIDQGDGCFTKSGAGTLNVTGTANISATCVNEGKLLANGSFASKVTVARGATLGGAGYIAGDVLVNGTLSPGNSPGMLTAASNITMASGSTYKEDIGGAVQASASTPVGAPGYYSYLHVVGAHQFTIASGATLAPALKDLYSASEAGYGTAAYVPVLGQSYRIVTVDGGIVGRFDTLLQPDGLASDTRLVAFYNSDGSNSIDLKVLPSSYAAWAQSDAGASAAATVLDRIATLEETGQASTRQDQLLFAVASSGATTLGGVLQGLGGAVHGALAAAGPQAGWDLQRSVLKHASDQQSRAVWLDVTASRGGWDDAAMAQEIDMRRHQVTLGTDLLRTPDTQVGVALSHAETEVSADAGSGKLRQNKVAVYGAAGVGALRFDALASYGRDNSDSSRADPLAPATRLIAHAGGNSAMLGAGVSAPVTLAGATYAPFARVTVQRVKRDAMSEGAASLAALALDADSASGTRLVAGLAGSSRNTDPLLASTVRYNVGAGVDAGALGRTAGQATLADSALAIAAPKTGRGFGQATITGTWQLNRGAYLYFGLDGEARKGYGQIGGNAGVRAVF